MFLKVVLLVDGKYIALRDPGLAEAEGTGSRTCAGGHHGAAPHGPPALTAGLFGAQYGGAKQHCPPNLGAAQCRQLTHSRALESQGLHRGFSEL